MKTLLSLIAVFAMTICNAQSFEWNNKSTVQSHPKEVQPADGSLAAYEKAYNERQTGMAGIYNPNANGSRTIYGETYKATELTASHTILPLGTLVRIINLDNNRNVTVRINDRGQECSDCLVMLSQAAADQLGVNYRGRVSIERVGFSNWNPAPPVAAAPAPMAYGSSAAPTNYSNTPAAGGQPGVVRPVTIDGQSYGWQAKGNTDNVPAGYGTPTNRSPQTYSSPTNYGSPARSDNYAVMSAPQPQQQAGSVMSREVNPATVANQPVITYSRRPATVTPQPVNSQPAAQPQPYQTYPPAYNPAPSPTVVPQATPPASTVVRYQENRTVPAPTSYQTPSPASYGTVARGVGQPVATAAPMNTSASGYAVQLGAYNNELYAKNRVNQLSQSGVANVFYRSVTKADGQIINRVYAGAFPTMAEAQQVANGIRNSHQIAGIVTSL